VNGRRQNALELIFMCGYIMAHHAHAESRGADKESCAKCEWTADENSSILLPLFSEPYIAAAAARGEERERDVVILLFMRRILFFASTCLKERETYLFYNIITSSSMSQR
jgi:hypothetical protein